VVVRGGMHHNHCRLTSHCKKKTKKKVDKSLSELPHGKIFRVTPSRARFGHVVISTVLRARDVQYSS